MEEDRKHSPHQVLSEDDLERAVKEHFAGIFRSRGLDESFDILYEICKELHQCGGVKRLDLLIKERVTQYDTDKG